MPFTYILECADGSFYTGSTKDLERRLSEHDSFLGANYTKKKHPVTLVYYEQYDRIDEAFRREKQIQGWSHEKKKALTMGKHDKLPELSIAYRDIHERVASRASATGTNSSATGENSLVTKARSPVTEARSPDTEARSPVTEARSSVTEALEVTMENHHA